MAEIPGDGASIGVIDDSLDLPTEAKGLAPLLNAHAEAGERLGKLTDEVVDALHERGYFGMWYPKSEGGEGLDPIQSLQLIENLAHADSSTGWVLMATALCIGTSYAYLGDSAVDEIFGDTAGGRLPVMAGQGHPNGIGIAQDGGYLLTGRWSFASGLKHSQYVYTAGFVHDAKGEQCLLDDGTPEVRVFVIPIEKIELSENWNVMGLRATGSIDYAIKDVFVPEAYTHIAATTTPLRGGSFYTLGLGAIAMIGHTGFAMGTMRRTLDELGSIVRAKADRPGSITHSESFLERYAAAEGNFLAARALVYETWRGITGTIERGEPLSTRQRTMIFLSLNRVTWIGQEVAMFAYLASGGIGLRASTLQRCFRDMHAGTQHFLVAPPILRHCARELVGLSPGGVWRGFELVDKPLGDVRPST